MNQSVFRELVPQVELQMANSMTSQKPHDVKINSVHSRAICEEIGERLQFAIPAAPARVPSRLLSLTARLDVIQRGGLLERLRLRLT
jgi:hypothetical protein